MPNLSLLSALDFTKSIGSHLSGDTKFNDASEVGKFPFEQKILRIEEINLYSDGRFNSEQAVIIGLTVEYLVEPPQGGMMAPTVRVTHGLRGIPSGSVIIQENEILVGASGKLRNLPNDPERNRRLSLIAFYVFNKDTGLAKVEGPFGSRYSEEESESWGSYGPIIAFQGTENPKLGLTSLSFTRLIQGVPDFGIAGK